MFAVGLCVDQRYLLPSLVSLLSLAEATPGPDRADIAIRVLTTDLTRPQVAAVAAAVRWLGFESFKARWATPAWAVVEGDYISPTTYLRFRFDRVFLNRPYLVYLDSDTLVLGELAGPLDTVTDGQVGLVRDLFNHTVGHGPALPGVVRRWPRLAGRPYFNAGAMWCPVGLLPRLRSDVDGLMRRYGRHIHYNDQDALNLWALGRNAVLALDPAYNSFETDRFRELGDWIVPIVEAARRASSPTILHFVGREKPWLTTCPPTAAVRLYRHYRARAARLLRATPEVSPAASAGAATWPV